MPRPYYAICLRISSFALLCLISTAALGAAPILELLQQLSAKTEVSHPSEEVANAHSDPFVDLAQGIEAIGYDPQLASHFLEHGGKNAPAELLPFIQYYQANIAMSQQDYKKAMDLLVPLQALQIWDARWQEKILGELFACSFFLNKYDVFLSLLRRHEAQVMRSPQLLPVLYYAAQIFETQKNYPKMLEYLELAAAYYPLTPEARSALQKLNDYSCETRENPLNRSYAFSTKTLKEIARNSALDPGIRNFVFASSHSKVRFNSEKASYLDDYEKIEFLFETRLYEEGLEHAKRLKPPHPQAFASNKDRQLLFLMGKLANRLNRHQEATRYFSLLRNDFKTTDPVFKINEYLADSLSYSGFRSSAANLYGHLARQSNNSLLRWHHFWNSYGEAQGEGALALIAGQGEGYVPPRDASYPHGSLYWKARLLEKQQQLGPAFELYRQVLRKSSDDLYSQFILAQHPSLAAEALQKAAATAKPSPKESGPKISPLPPKTREQKLLFIDHLLNAGLTDLAKMLLNSQPLKEKLNRHPEQVLSLAEKAHAYYPVYYHARQQIVAKQRQLHGWYETLAHQEKFAALWKNYYPFAYPEFLQPIASSLDLDPYLVLSIMRAESEYRENALSYVGARGLMQIMPYTAMQIAQRLDYDDFHLEDMANPQVNIAFGSWYLKFLLNYYQSHPALAIAAYNAGPLTVNAWYQRCQSCSLDEFIESISYKETRQYVKEVLKHLSRYHRLYEGKDMINTLPPLPSTLPLSADLF